VPKPNPIENSVFIENATIGTSYSLGDITGRQLMQGQIKAAKEILNIGQLAHGTYFIELINDNIREIRKIIKQ
jgi:Secretion system C-terminal sorting domain